MVWGLLSWLRQDTSVPALTVITDGWNPDSVMATKAAATGSCSLLAPAAGSSRCAAETALCAGPPIPTTARASVAASPRTSFLIGLTPWSYGRYVAVRRQPGAQGPAPVRTAGGS